jgi:hypothetical protein
MEEFYQKREKHLEEEVSQAKIEILKRSRDEILRLEEKVKEAFKSIKERHNKK